jgi:hypothetical protein
MFVLSVSAGGFYLYLQVGFDSFTIRTFLGRCFGELYGVKTPATPPLPCMAPFRATRVCTPHLISGCRVPNPESEPNCGRLSRYGRHRFARARKSAIFCSGPYANGFACCVFVVVLSLSLSLSLSPPAFDLELRVEIQEWLPPPNNEARMTNKLRVMSTYQRQR